MIGAIAGDIIGSPYEHHPFTRKDFELFGERCRFTDDTVLTVATAEVLLDGGDYADAYRRWTRSFPRRGYGGRFRRWAAREGAGPYNSFGNGSAMRVAPVGWALESLDEVLREAEPTAAVTHDHPEGIKGAQAVAAAVFLARTGVGREAIRAAISDRFGYRLDRAVDEIRPGYGFDVTCQGSVPEALVAFLDAHGWEDAVRNAVSLGGDADTQAAIAGAVAEARWGVPDPVRREVERRLPAEILDVVRRFGARYGP